MESWLGLFSGGFATKSEAREFLRSQLDEIVALRRGDLGALGRREMPTLNQLADEYLAGHGSSSDAFRSRRSSERATALRAAGLEHRGIYALRHSYASFVASAENVASER